MGSATVHSLSRRGLSVLGLERFTPFHGWGSSHGETRIFRRSLSDPDTEGPLLELAQMGWKRLEQDSGRSLFQPIGTLVIGNPDKGLLRQTLVNAAKWGLPMDLYTADQLSKKYPRFRMPPEDRAFLERDSGFLLSGECMRLQQQLAREAGAQLQFEERVLSWIPTENGVEVRSERGVYRARKLVATVGPWFAHFFPELGDGVRVDRQNVIWLQTPPGFQYPTFDWQVEEESFLYGIPAPGGGKVGLEKTWTATDADILDRLVDAAGLEEVMHYLRPRIPQLAALPLAASSGCLYTRHPNDRFRIGRHPDCPSVLLAGVFQGLGFKFAAGVGEVMADLVEKDETAVELTYFQ